MLSLISKQEVAILEAYQDSREERRENLDRKLYGPLLPNASVNDTNYTRGPEQQSDVLRADNVEPTKCLICYTLLGDFLVARFLCTRAVC